LQAEGGFAIFGLGAGVVLQRHFDAFVDDAGFEFGRGDGATSMRRKKLRPIKSALEMKVSSAPLLWKQ